MAFDNTDMWENLFKWWFIISTAGGSWIIMRQSNSEQRLHKRINDSDRMAGESYKDLEKSIESFKIHVVSHYVHNEQLEKFLAEMKETHKETQRSLESVKNDVHKIAIALAEHKGKDKNER